MVYFGYTHITLLGFLNFLRLTLICQVDVPFLLLGRAAHECVSWLKGNSNRHGRITACLCAVLSIKVSVSGTV